MTVTSASVDLFYLAAIQAAACTMVVNSTVRQTIRMLISRSLEKVDIEDSLYDCFHYLYWRINKGKNSAIAGQVL